MDPSAAPAIHPVWHAIGVAGAIIFFSRFYVQWWASERQKRSVMPPVFWYLSSVGAVMLLAFALYEQSPVGALSYSLNSIVYTRNLVHIWREHGTVSKPKRIAYQVFIGVITLVSLAILIVIWYREIEHTRGSGAGQAAETWLWIAVGALGSVLFGTRFIVQWIATEMKRKSVVPHVFWHISIAASVLQFASYVHRAEWVYALGLVATVPIYARNLWLIYRGPASTESQPGLVS